MIDVSLFILMVFLGVACFLMGWVFCRIFHRAKDECDQCNPCNTIDDVIKREV